MKEAITILQADLKILRRQLKEKERSAATIEKYLHDAGLFIQYLDGRPMTAEEALGFKRQLIAQGLSASSVNCRIAAVNALFAATGFERFRLRKSTAPNVPR